MIYLFIYFNSGVMSPERQWILPLLTWFFCLYYFGKSYICLTIYCIVIIIFLLCFWTFSESGEKEEDTCI